MNKEGSRILRAANSLRCLTGRFTEFSESELPNSTVTGVTYITIVDKFYFGSMCNSAFICGGGVFGGIICCLVDLIILIG